MNDMRMFCVCEKCEGRIYVHDGVLEAPSGSFTFKIVCPSCKFEFSYHYNLERIREKAHQKQMLSPLKLLGKMLNPKTLARIQVNVQKEIEKQEDEDEKA